MHHIISGKNQLLIDILQKETKLTGSTWIKTQKYEMMKLDLNIYFPEISRTSNTK